MLQQHVLFSIKVIFKISRCVPRIMPIIITSNKRLVWGFFFWYCYIIVLKFPYYTVNENQCILFVQRCLDPNPVAVGPTIHAQPCCKSVSTNHSFLTQAWDGRCVEYKRAAIDVLVDLLPAPLYYHSFPEMEGCAQDRSCGNLEAPCISSLPWDHLEVALWCPDDQATNIW